MTTTYPLATGETGVVNAAFPYGDVRRYGAAVNGSTDDTAALTAAQTAVIGMGGGVVTLPPGVICGHLLVQGGNATTKRVRIVGSGMGGTFLVPFTVNRPAVQKSLTSNACDGYYLGGFTIIAHPSGGVGSGAAVDMCGFRASTIEDVDYIDNGTGHFEYMFTLSAVRSGMTGATCYFNTISRPRLFQVSVGMKTMIRFENDGTGVAANNANSTTIIDPVAYANTNLVSVVDALRSAGTMIINPRFESNTGAKAIIAGNAQITLGGWLEANVANDEISFQSVVDGTANNTSFIAVYLSSSGVITIPSTCQNNDLRGLILAGGKTIVDNGAGNLVQNGSVMQGQSPDFIRTFKNVAAGGGSWAEIIGATGSSFGAGMRVLYDVTNSKARDFLQPLWNRQLYAGATGAAAVRLVPFDDTTASQPVLEVSDAAQATLKAWITKDGSGRFTTLGVGNAASASTPGSIVKKIEVFDKSGTSLGFLPVYNTIT